MKFFSSTAVVLAAITGFASATPVRRQDNSTNSTISETQILQFALTLEHLENTFYTQALQRFDDSAFQQAGFPSFVRGRFQQISNHEQSHVQLLTGILGSNAPAACNYSFPYNDPRTFANLSYIFESVGTSAYIGGSQYLVNNTKYLLAAGSILSTEARHASWVKSSVSLAEPWSSPYDVALTGNMVYTLASPFITSCPSSNPQLPFKAFPTLNITSAANNSTTPNLGETVNLSYQNSTQGGNQYLVLLYGRNTTFVSVNNSQATIPSNLQGLVFAAVTSSNSSNVTDENIIAGPTFLQFDFGPEVSNY